MIPNSLKTFADRALVHLQKDSRILGVAVGGSWATGELDAFSDIDFTLVAEPSQFLSVVRDMQSIAETLGPCLSAFPADHLGIENLLICLFDDPLLHIDLKFITPTDLSQRTENPLILWERERALSHELCATKPIPAHLDLQWVENRFWTWLHYATLRLARGELFETVDFLSYIRVKVLGPMILTKAGKPPHGVRRIENYAPEDAQALRLTIAGYDRKACKMALKASAKIYVDLREMLAQPTLNRNYRSEMATLRFLHEASEARN